MTERTDPHNYDALPLEAVGLKLYKIVREELIACEAVKFIDGRAAVETILRRAAISGRVEVEGDIGDYFADVLAENQDIVATVALDRNSYNRLKSRWMRCKIEHH